MWGHIGLTMFYYFVCVTDMWIPWFYFFSGIELPFKRHVVGARK